MKALVVKKIHIQTLSWHSFHQRVIGGADSKSKRELMRELTNIPIKKYYFVLCFKKNSLPLHSLSSFIVYESFWLDSLAQLVEHNTFNVGVMGSSPMRVTKY